MSHGVRFAEGVKVYTSFPPKNIAGLTTNTNHTNISDANWVSFLISIGVTSSAASADLEISAVCSTAETSAAAVPTIIPFWYRLSSTLGTSQYSWGAITTGSTAGNFAVTTGQDNIQVWIDVDPADCGAVGEDYKWCYLLLQTSASEMHLSAVSFVEPRHMGNTIRFSS